MGRLHVVRGHSAFAELAGTRRRVREGPVTVRHVPRPDDHRVAFAIGRRVGPAVVRNRLRRRLRPLVAEAVVDPTLGLPTGDYLIGVGREGASLDQAGLRAPLWRALERIAQDPR